MAVSFSDVSVAATAEAESVRPLLPPPPPHLFKSNSAYCTQIPPEAAASRFEAAAGHFEAAPGYSSLPSWYGGLRQPPMLPLLFLEAAKALELESAAAGAAPPPQMVYNSHPADEEKRLAFTRGTAPLLVFFACG